MTDLIQALACAAMLTGLPPTDTLPNWEQRELTKVERWLTNRPRNARAMYDYKQMLIVTLPGDWSALVHESVHFLEHMSGLDFSEERAERAEGRAEECRPRTELLSGPDGSAVREPLLDGIWPRDNGTRPAATTCTLNGEDGACTVTVEVMK